MRTHVFNQVGSTDESLGALLALVIFDVQMSLKVDAEVVPVAEFTAACVAFSRMNGHVVVEAADTFEDGMADNTHKNIRLGWQNGQLFIDEFIG